MSRDFRRLGSDRNSVAVNKAVGNPGTGPVSNPVIGSIASGEVATVTWDGLSLTATTFTEARRTGAVRIEQTLIYNRIEWYVSGNVLTVTITDGGGEVAADYLGLTASFWVF